ncbi:WapI family immunity protein [Bacillus suaedaesalsae]|uniref:Uncharacterized protein n=1 Tax=Bacillus suaedaesalsae TaxID=2810349 RepID=A0ABS2DGL5_9BACI|nr:hypothetical protein [Bacillus suaedaesalsae]MBM6616691.1 hypothetical protein [Bacillus suaedaesalsae]
MLIQGEDRLSFIKIHFDKEDSMGVRFSIETQSKGFSATLGGIYILTDDLSDFLISFRNLENKRSGEASLKSASPKELDFTIRIIDRRGHCMVSLKLNDLGYYEDEEIPCKLEVCFGIDPTTLLSLLVNFENIYLAAK